MIQSFSFEKRREEDIIIISLSGYLEKEGGGRLKECINGALQEGVRKVIFDFHSIELINSPGMAALLEIGGRVVEEMEGKIVVFGLDAHHQAVLELSTFFWLASQASDEAGAREAIHQQDA